MNCQIPAARADEPLGAETLVTVQGPAGRLTARTTADFTARTGEPVWFRVEPGRVLWFDESSEQRVDVVATR
jgi:hypothetical protein